MDPSGRLLRLLALFQSRPTWTADELAEHLGVTPRTVRRDVSRLRQLGYPVDASPGRFGGYELGVGGRLPPLVLDEEEAVVIALALRAAAAGGVGGLEDVALATVTKLDQLLPGPLRHRVAELDAVTVGLTGRPGPRVTTETLVALAQGCRRLERVRFGYTSATDEVSERTVEPYRLVLLRGRWYLVARDVRRQAWRTFRVDRVADVAMTGHRFVRDEEPDAAAMVAEGVALAPYPWLAEVVLDAPLEEAARVVPATVGTLRALGSRTVLRIGGELDWLARYLVSLPFPWSVEAPPELRAELVAMGEALAARHRGSGPVLAD